MKLRVFLAAAVAIALFIFLLRWFGAFDTIPAPSCADGWPSPSIGIIGACSHHGGVVRPQDNRGLAWLGALVIAYLAFAAMCGDAIESKAPTSSVSKGLFTKGLKKQTIICPKCGARMVTRLAKKGRHKGEKFWGCTKYPRCLGLLPFSQDTGEGQGKEPPAT